MAIGCAGTDTQRGVIMIGRRSTSARIISKDRLPEPMMIEARNSMVCTPQLRKSPRPPGGSGDGMRACCDGPRALKIDNTLYTSLFGDLAEMACGPTVLLLKGSR
jgi:hypothetical protein